VVVANLVLWFLLVGVTWRRGLAGRFGVRTYLGLALLPVAAGALLSVFVFGEDSYRDNGINRWDAYYSPGGAVHVLYMLSALACCVLAAVLALAGVKARHSICRIAGIVGGLGAGLLTTITFIAYSSN
jgi:hypothetical protein